MSWMEEEEGMKTEDPISVEEITAAGGRDNYLMEMDDLSQEVFEKLEQGGEDHKHPLRD